jgi:conjugative relaxase-like TrwC/TraI family protein
VHLRLGSLFAWGGVVVLSVAKLTVGQEAYYEQQVAGGVDDYYAGRGESPGLWAGSGAEGLSLAGVVEDGDLGTLLRGVNPASEVVLRAPVRERTITVRTLDLESGEWRQQRKRLAPVSGYDLVFSCPKSVSLLHALSDDEHVRSEVSEAHERAWQAALGYLEHEACVVRRGKGGQLRERGEGFVAAAFRHRTSRAQDPHLHTHVVVANLTRTSEGEWRALDGEALLKTYRLAAGYLYEAQLRHELTCRLGLGWTEPVKGMAELERVPEEAIRAFSTRRQSLVEHMQALGTEGFGASRIAALATREAKEQVELPRLRDDWRARAAEHGLGRRGLEALVAERSQRPHHVEREQLAARVFGPDGLTATQTTFTMPELVQAVAGSLPHGATVDTVLETAEELSRFPGVELVEPGGVPGWPARFTTRELLALEREALQLALTGRDVDAPRPDERALMRTLLDTRALSNEQRRLIHDASLSRDRVVCVVGVAGSGKTRALRALADAHRESEITVLGAAPSGRAADELATAAGIPASTLHRLLLDAHREGGLPRRSLLVVDEAGMAETRVLAPLLRLVDQAAGKALLVGDPGQLPPVGAGGLYPALCQRLGAIELSENRRQRDLTERQALTRLRAGDPEAYLAHAARHGRLQLADNPTVAKHRLLQDWWQAAQHDLHGTVMLAYRRTDVQELNDAARTLLRRAGRLGTDAAQLGGREFRAGDRVLCRHNHPRIGVRNGTRGTIVDLDRTAIALRTDHGTTRLLPAGYAADHLEHGYALTGHAAQGATLERAYVLIHDHGALQEWGYVAGSRARTQTRLYLAQTEPEHHDLHTRQPDTSNAPERTARALAHSCAEPLALDQTRSISEETARAFAERQRQLERAQRRAAQRLARANAKLHELGWRGRGRRGDNLRTEIAAQRAALRLADEMLAQLVNAPEGLLAARVERELAVLTRERSRQLLLKRDGHAEQSRTLQRERGFGLER